MAQKLADGAEFLGLNPSKWHSKQQELELAAMADPELAEKVEALIAARISARNDKNWAEADRIRDELVAMGIVLMDAKNPRTGELETSWELK